jgi:hypothetical protein
MADGTRRISLSLSASVDDKRVYIGNAQLLVGAENETEKTPLGSAVTNMKGKAFFEISSGTSIPQDKEGYYTFVIRYDGNQKFTLTSKTIRIKELFMEISFPKTDSVINVQVKVSAKNDKGVIETVQDVPVEFFVKRLFCLFRFGSEKTDASGICTAEFPRSIPGDTTGKVIIVTKVLDHETYGTVGASLVLNGGNPVVLEPKQRRGLGDTDAPLWMVYTLLVLLTGVWFHVIYVIGLVIRINIKGKRELKKAGITK